jgi:hypothetical protein
MTTEHTCRGTVYDSASRKLASKFGSTSTRTKTIHLLLTNLRPGYAPSSPDRSVERTP